MTLPKQYTEQEVIEIKRQVWISCRRDALQSIYGGMLNGSVMSLLIRRAKEEFPDPKEPTIEPLPAPQSLGWTDIVRAYHAGADTGGYYERYHADAADELIPKAAETYARLTLGHLASEAQAEQNLARRTEGE